MALDRESADERARQLFNMVGLEAKWLQAYPHELSGGMRQKALIAMSLSCKPEILIADEPTMALDSESKAEIIDLLKRLQSERGFSMIAISHELQVVSALTSRILVMYTGNVVEVGPTRAVLEDPLHPYTRGLTYASPSIHPFRDMWGIPGEIVITEETQCPFYSRCTQRIPACLHQHPALETIRPDRQVACLRGGIVTLLTGVALNKTYRTAGGAIRACDQCDIAIRAGEVVALIGQSARQDDAGANAVRNYPSDTGTAVFDGRTILGNSRNSQNRRSPRWSFRIRCRRHNEALSIEQIVRERWIIS
jgi:peptide/nickel transport system ATP-binding protein